MKRTAVLFSVMLAAIAGISAPAAVSALAAADGPPAASRFRGVMLRGNPDAMTEDDFATLGRWGANLVRFQMPVGWRKPRHWESNDDYDAYIGHCLDVLQEKVLAWADAHGQKVVLDLHATPGSRTEDMESRVFLEQRYADHFVETWRRIAERFKGDRRLYGYDLMNEPLLNGEGANRRVVDLQLEAARAIRAVDPEATIIVEVNNWDGPGAFRDLEALPLGNVIYQVHCYHPMPFTHQGVSTGNRERLNVWPDPEKGWDMEFLRTNLAPVRDFQLRTGARIYVGEFSAVAWAPGAENYLRDCIRLFEEYGWDWSYHAFREWDGWSVEKTWTGRDGDRDLFEPSEDNPRKRALLDGFRADNPHIP